MGHQQRLVLGDLAQAEPLGDGDHEIAAFGRVGDALEHSRVGTVKLLARERGRAN